MFKKMSLMIVAQLILGSLSLSIAQNMTAALIVSDINLTLGFDQAQKDRLEALGYQVTLATGQDVKNDVFTMTEAQGYDILVVSESIGSGDVNKLIGVSVPMMHQESYGWSRHFFTAGLKKAWNTPADGKLDIVNDTHPIVSNAGLSAGTVTFFTDPTVAITTDDVTSLVPKGVNLLQTNDAESNAVTCIFAIEKGTILANGSPAASRVVGFSLPGNNNYTADKMSTEAWALYDAAIAWLDATPVDQMVANWTMDDGAGTTVTDAVSGNNGTMLGLDPTAAWIADGALNGAVRFDDIIDHCIEVPHADVLDFADESFSVSLLVRYLTPAAATERWIIKGTHKAPGTGSRYELYHTGGDEIRWSIDDNIIKTDLKIMNRAVFETGEWVHVVAIRDAANDSLLLYADGIFLGGTKDKTGDISNGEVLWIGESADEHNSPMSGDIDDVRIYNYALSEEQIETILGDYGIVKKEMIAHWKLDETSGSVAADETGNSDGTLINGADSLWVSGWDGNAIDFATAVDSAYISVPDNNTIGFDSTESFTISVLIKADPVGNQNEQQIIDKGAYGVDATKGWTGKWYGMQFKGGEARIAVDDNVTKTQLGVNITSIWPRNRWAHFVAIRDIGEDSLKLYLNGDLIGSIEDLTDGDISSPGQPLLMGLNYNDERQLDGQLDDVRIYNHALSAADVKTLFETYGISKNGMIAQWKLEDNANDVFGTSDGTLNNIDAAMFVAGQDGKAIDFNAGPDSAYIAVPDNDIVDFDSTMSFTISALINTDPTAVATEYFYIQKGYTSVNAEKGGDGKWYSMAFKGGEARFAIDDNVTKTQLGVNITAIFPVNQWVHMVGVRDMAEDSLKLYMNGQLIGSIEDATDGDISSSLPLIIGNNQDQNFAFKGMLDEVQMYNYALSADDVNDLFESYNIPVMGLVAHWPLDEGTGTVVTDVVGGNNGTMVGLDPAAAWITDGALNGAVRFANINDQRIEVPSADAIDFGDEDFTVSMLVRYLTPATDTDRWLIKGTHAFPAGTGCRYELYHTGGDEIRWSIDDNIVKTDLKIMQRAPFETGDWVHVVAIRNAANDSLLLYANGVWLGGTHDKTGDISSPGEPLWIGESTDEHTSGMSGDIDDVRLYNYALTADNVKALFDTYGITSSIDNEGVIPKTYALMQNYPNPFNPATTIKFQLKEAGQTTICVYNSVGQIVSTLLDKKLETGSHSVTARFDNFSSGVYFYQIKSGEFSQTKKMLLMK